MTYSFLAHLQCSQCQAEHNSEQVQGLCSCGAPLLARYDLGRVASAMTPATFADRDQSMWRYHELLPIRDARSVVSLGERVTPLLPLPRIGDALGLESILMKDEGILPTGTFKARGAAVGISRAQELGVRKVAMPTNGNAGAAWAAYAARAGMDALIVMPLDAPSITRAEVTVYRGKLRLVDGLIGDAGQVSAKAVANDGYTDVSTLKEPYRLEGKKTMGFELCEQFGWDPPDVVLYPAGGGVGLIGIFKALCELQELGWLIGDFPRLVAVQASGCAPIVRAWAEGADHADAWPKASTVAFGINVGNPLGDRLMLQAIRETKGCAIAVDDEDILKAQRRLGGLEGVFVCPEGAACLAAAEVLRDRGWIASSDRVVLLNTGTGLKYPNTIPAAVDETAYAT